MIWTKSHCAFQRARKRFGLWSQRHDAPIVHRPCEARLGPTPPQGTLWADRRRFDEDFLLPKLLGHSKPSVNFGCILVHGNIVWICFLMDLPHELSNLIKLLLIEERFYEQRECSCVSWLNREELIQNSVSTAELHLSDDFAKFM